MRRLLVLFVTLVVSSVVSVPAHADDGLDMVPPDAAGVVTIESLSRLYKTLGLGELRAERPEAFRTLTEQMIEDVGIDLLDPASMHDQGFDVDRPLHVAILTDPSVVVVLIPGEPRGLSWVRAKIEEQGAHFTQELKHKGTVIEGGEADELACFARDNYISIVVTDKENSGEPATATAKRLIDRSWGKPITQTDTYRKVMDRLPAEADVKVYMGPGLQRRMSNWGKSKKQLAERGVSSEDMDRSYELMGLDKAMEGMSLRLGPDRLSLDSYTWVGKDSPILGWFKVGHDPVPFLRRTPAAPWMILLGRLNAGAVWRTLRPIMQQVQGDSSETVEDALARAKQEIGVDLETEVIDQIDGNVGFIVDRVSVMGQEAMVLAQVKDPDRFRATVATVTQRARDEMAANSQANPNRPATEIVEDSAGDVSFYRIVAPMTEVCYGVVGDHFVVTTSSKHFREIVDGATGFVDELKNKDVKSALTSDASGVFYVDFRGFANDARGLLPMFGPAGEEYAQWLDELSELVSISRVDGEGGYQTATLTSTTPGIWKRLIALALDSVDQE